MAIVHDHATPEQALAILQDKQTKRQGDKE
jgi:hypothetical protein